MNSVLVWGFIAAVFVAMFIWFVNFKRLKSFKIIPLFVDKELEEFQNLVKQAKEEAARVARLEAYEIMPKPRLILRIERKILFITENDTVEIAIDDTSFSLKLLPNAKHKVEIKPGSVRVNDFEIEYAGKKVMARRMMSA